MRAALAEAKPYARGRMLDIGCGLRPYQNIFSEVTTSYIGMDYPTAREKARPDLIADALALPIAGGSIDTTLATELMEHLPDPNQFLKQIATVLRPSGTFIFSVPFMEPLHEEPRDYFRFTPYSLRAMLTQHGFEVQNIAAKGGWWSVVLGSFVSQGVYDAVNPLQPDGSRRDGFMGLLALPICAFVQWLGHALDRIGNSSKYTLGYVVIARLRSDSQSTL